ncbi:16S rRNA (cytosine(1402)-N(4))-methyltransferase RsmH [bacterium]|nr:16S rRNA (cytosine(1402)-N(4))-methyltransferase RsmH [bacterium]
MNGKSNYHIPVLKDRVLEFLALAPEGTIIDATLGDGGHSKALLESRDEISILGIDKDPQAIERSSKRLALYKDRIKFVQGDFSDLEAIARDENETRVSGILFDLGISSLQIDKPERGFSFSNEAELDMRMSNTGISAKEFINSTDFETLTKILYEFGEVKHAKKIAAEIIASRDRDKMDTTWDLNQAIARAIPYHKNPDFARVFQAIRIHINGELERLRRGLTAALDLLIPDGVIVVISYHSLEDRIVKRYFFQESKGCICPPELPQCRCGHTAQIRLISKKPFRPSNVQVMENSRSRSAKLRYALKL